MHVRFACMDSSQYAPLVLQLDTERFLQYIIGVFKHCDEGSRATFRAVEVFECNCEKAILLFTVHRRFMLVSSDHKQ